MKTNNSLTHHTSGFSAKPCLFAIALAAFLVIQSQSAHAGGITYNLTLTENSATDLTVAYTGPGGASSFSVLNTSPDNWTITILSQTIFLSDFEYDFAEPEDPTNQFVNAVSHSTDFNSDQMFVTSDLPIAMDSNGYVGTGTIIGTDAGSPIFLTFNDLAGASEAGVPDAGSSLGLLALSGAVLLSASRFRSLRSA
jgi:hypothetical protein